jgi:hypothetical protein
MALNDYIICLALSPASASAPTVAAAAAFTGGAGRKTGAEAEAEAKAEAVRRKVLTHSRGGLSQAAVRGYITALREVLAEDAEAGHRHQLLMPRVRVRIEEHVEQLKQWQLVGTPYDAKFLY